jgi:hypothetical protein
MSVYELPGVCFVSSSVAAVPERGLLIAILDRAVLDYFETPPGDSSDAEEWLFGDSDPTELFSFQWVCDLLKLDPEALRRRIRYLCLTNNFSVARGWIRTKVQSKHGQPVSSYTDSRQRYVELELTTPQ